ncbi:MAG: AAA family ATPase [Bacteroidetes bacterium]|nr:AAA family ATPase [Bacteroidota bacterium]MDA1121324.1 AAA family ATPase [Bacteroidota bacterium]
MNPFKYGDVVTKNNFCNRKGEINRLHEAFRDSQNIILISPRRWGKSSLVEESIRKYGQSIIVAKIDCFRCRSVDEFYSLLLKSVLKASDSTIQEIIKTAQKFLGDIISSISFSSEISGEIKIAVELPKRKKDPGYILDLSQRIAKEKKMRFLICIDEFQKIAEWQDSTAVLAKLRSHWMHHDQVCYCLYGSKKHLMNTIFTDSAQPFYRFGETIFLKKIPNAEWLEFITGKFQDSGKTIENDASHMILQLSQSHSYYTLYLCRLIWSNSDKLISTDVVAQAFEYFLADHDDIFIRLTDHLTRYQINYLRAICAGELKLSSQKVLREYDLGSSGNIKRIEKVMKDLEIIDYSGGQPTFSEPYFSPLFERRFLD